MSGYRISRQMAWVFAIGVILQGLLACKTITSPPALPSQSLSLPTLSSAIPPLSASLPGYFRPVIGLCEDYPKGSRTIAHARADLEVCRATGARALRIAFSWLDMEPEKGRYDFSFWDEFVPMAVKEYHVRLIPYVCYTPEWAASESGSEYWHSPPKDVDDFAQFVGVLVKRYKGYIHSWELWNEPDNRAYWTGSVEQFAALVKAGSTAVRAEDPKATVVLGGIAGTTSFVAQLLRDEQVSPVVDVINVHAYFETWNEDPLESIPDYLRKVHDLIAQYGNHQKIWMAEAGYSDFRKPGSGYVSNEYAARFGFEHTAAFQGEALERAVTLALATNDVELIAWYRINDLPSGENVIGDVNNRYLGIVDVHGKRKPAFEAMKRVTAFYGERLRSVDARVLRIAPIWSAVEVHAFGTENGEWLIAAWERTDVAGEGKRGSAGAARETGTGTVSLLFPGVELRGEGREAQVERRSSGSLVRVRVRREGTVMTKCLGRGQGIRVRG